jgi:hypothetical protein
MCTSGGQQNTTHNILQRANIDAATRCPHSRHDGAAGPPSLPRPPGGPRPRRKRRRRRRSWRRRKAHHGCRRRSRRSGQCC